MRPSASITIAFNLDFAPTQDRLSKSDSQIFAASRARARAALT
jgi:hypothetical protein